MLLGESEGIVKKTYEENKEWFRAIFESVEPWQNSFAVEENEMQRCSSKYFEWGKNTHEIKLVLKRKGTAYKGYSLYGDCYCSD